MGNVGDVAFSQGDLMRRVHKLEEQLRMLAAARRLENATIGAGGLRIKGAGGLRLQAGGSLTVEDGGDILIEGGDLVVTGDGVMRSETFDGNMAVLDPGSTGWAIGSDRVSARGALLRPLDTKVTGGQAIGFAVNLAEEARGASTVVAPSWATTANLHTVVTASIRNTSGVVDIAYLSAHIDNSNGGEMYVTLDAGKQGALAASWAQNMAVVGDQVITVSAHLRTEVGNWSSDVANMAEQTTTVVFTGPA